jgi:hypothetical protein
MISFRLYKISIFPGFLLAILVIVSFQSCEKQNTKIMDVRNDSIAEISNTTAKAFATIIDIGSGIDQHGHCWSTFPGPEYGDDDLNSTKLGKVTKVGPYTSEITGLEPGTKYFIRAYVKNGEETRYSKDEPSFTTSKIIISLPVVTIGSVENLSINEATVSGTIEELGTGATSVSEHGHCWSATTTTPTINDYKTSHGEKTSTGSFTSTLVGLSPGTTYYVRAYATNPAGTAYSNNNIGFTTPEDITIPSVTTTEITEISYTTAVSGGFVISNGGAAVTAKGVCWNTSPNPTLINSRTTDGEGTGAYISDITGLAPGTTYYVRAYATNSIGTAYGEEKSFTTFEESLIAYYTLNNSPEDITGNNPDMILENTPYTDNSIYCNGIYKLFGDPNYCDAYTPEISTISYDELTFCVEFKITDTTDYYNPVLVAGAGVGHDRWIGFAVHSDFKFALHGSNFSLEDTSDVECQIDTWYEARITYNSSTSRGDLYINENLVCSANFTLNLNYAHKSVGITNYANGTVFKGYLRNLKIYNKVVEP